MFNVKRNENNPLLSPKRENYWESYAAFNWSPVKDGSKIHLLYRAMSEPHVMDDQGLRLSTVGYVETKDGKTFKNRKQLIVPEYAWEKYGCEDARVTKIGNKFYIFYTALSVYPFEPSGIKTAVAITRDFKTIDEKHLVTPFNSKAMVLFPEKINGKFVAILTAYTDPSKIAIAEFTKESDMWDEHYWRKWEANIDSHLLQDPRRSNNDYIEVGAAPIKTPYGWLLIYSHIQNYYHGQHIFGVEALLLDKKDPRKIIGRTKSPFLIPEEIYEIFGQVPNIVFPTGALIDKNKLTVYYGAADTTCCTATLPLDELLRALSPSPLKKRAPLVTRYKKNPVLKPINSHSWESKFVFNPAAIDIGGKVHLFYRAQGEDNISRIGYATSKNAVDFKERLTEPVYVPRAKFESPQGNGSGCEDPRVVRIKDKIYMCYTAYDGANPPKVAISSLSISDLNKKRWNWSEPYLITPEGIDDKDASLFPEKIGKQYAVLHRVHHYICADFLDTLDFSKNQVNKCIQILGPRRGMWDSRKVGISGPPFKTSKGWVLFYHGIGEDNSYSMGAALLDLKNPSKVLSRTATPIMTPSEKYEREGQIPNVVFPCGQIVRKGKIYLYYGGADTVIGVATLSLKELLKILSDKF